MLEPVRLLLYAVHENNAYPGKRIVVELADRLLDQVPPGKYLLLQRCTSGIEQLNGHRSSCQRLKIENCEGVWRCNIRAADRLCGLLACGWKKRAILTGTMKFLRGKTCNGAGEF
jgi:hypothetical protein